MRVLLKSNTRFRRSKSVMTILTSDHPSARSRSCIAYSNAPHSRLWVTGRARVEGRRAPPYARSGAAGSWHSPLCPPVPALADLLAFRLASMHAIRRAVVSSASFGRLVRIAHRHLLSSRGRNTLPLSLNGLATPDRSCPRAAPSNYRGRPGWLVASRPASDEDRWSDQTTRMGPPDTAASGFPPSYTKMPVWCRI